MNSHHFSISRSAGLSLAILLTTAVCALAAPAVRAQDLARLNRFLQGSDSTDPGMQVFNKGRDYIQDEKWADAVQMFDQFIKGYPHNAKTDAALYWLAYSLKKQEDFRKADAALQELFKDYPKSSWINDARAMAAEIGPRLEAANTAVEGRNSDPDEIKMAALQGLFMSNPERATAIASEILKPGSSAHPNLKRAALSLIAQNGGKQAEAILEGLVRNESDPQLRGEAIFWFGKTGGDHALDVLKELAASQTDAEVAKSAAFAISQSDSPRAAQILKEMAHSSRSQEVKQTAILCIARLMGEKAVDDLLEIYNSDHNPQVGGQVIFALGQIGGQRVKAELLKIAKTGYDPEVRRQAIFALGNSDGATDELVALYDSESDIEIKKQIVFSLSRSDEKKAINKIIDIARNDKSSVLKREAVMCLGRSKDPDAEKFLEEILK
ncbi:MAG TPA: HEAT repeat domain-containing protein [Blastocatellia bacterium]|nr:HEAT repeat domain-containing protein [Blastocatellia bacterium]